jgi:metal-responsive CopG/Arc/MetJ family transcriptional regulator
MTLEKESLFEKYYKGKTINLLLGKETIKKLDEMKIELGVRSRCEVVRMAIKGLIEKGGKK